MAKRRKTKHSKHQRSLVYYPELRGDVLGLAAFQKRIAEARRGRKKDGTKQTYL